MLPRDPVTKRCACMDDAGAYTLYNQPPGDCRTYDFRGDTRVFDFDARIPAPLHASLRPEPSAGDADP